MERGGARGSQAEELKGARRGSSRERSGGTRESKEVEEHNGSTGTRSTASRVATYAGELFNEVDEMRAARTVAGCQDNRAGGRVWLSEGFLAELAVFVRAAWVPPWVPARCRFPLLVPFGFLKAPFSC